MSRGKLIRYNFLQYFKLSLVVYFFLTFFCFVTTVQAQESKNRVNKNSDWSVFVESNPTECWAVTSPKETVNTKDGSVVYIRRDNILLFVFYRPPDNVKGQVAFTGGYPFAKGRNISMDIDGVSNELSVEGEWAWLPNDADDPKIIAAMKRGAKAVVTAQSERGTVTKDTFSLQGFTAAVQDAAVRCGVSISKPKVAKPKVATSTEAAQD